MLLSTLETFLLRLGFFFIIIRFIQGLYCERIGAMSRKLAVETFLVLTTVIQDFQTTRYVWNYWFFFSILLMEQKKYFTIQSIWVLNRPGHDILWQDNSHLFRNIQTWKIRSIWLSFFNYRIKFRKKKSLLILKLQCFS